MQPSRGTNATGGGDRTPSSSRGQGRGSSTPTSVTTTPPYDRSGSVNAPGSDHSNSSLGEQLRQPRRVRRHSSSSSGHGSLHGSSGMGSGGGAGAGGGSGMATESGAGRAGSKDKISRLVGTQRWSRQGAWTTLEDSQAGEGGREDVGGMGGDGGEGAMLEEGGTLKLESGVKRYKQWRGNNKFFMDGRVMLGVHWKQLFATAAIMAVSWAMYFIIIYPDINQWPYAVAAVLLFLGSMVTLVMSSLTDPGIIPRRPFNRLVDSMPPDMKDQLNYCSTCHVLRPPRAKHCRHCNNCVLRFDHHCPWTGNCVGRRNYRSFFAFLLLTEASACFVLGLSVVSITTRLADAGPEGLTDAGGIRGSKYAAPVLAAWTLVVVTLVGAMWAFHTFLLCRGQTTNEFLRGEHRRGAVPHKPFLQNCWDLWCDDIPETQLPPMHLAQDESDRKADEEYAAELASSMKVRQSNKSSQQPGQRIRGAGETTPTASAGASDGVTSTNTSTSTATTSITSNNDNLMVVTNPVNADLENVTIAMV